MCPGGGRLLPGHAKKHQQKTMKTATSIADIKALPFFAQFTDEQVKRVLANNAKQIRGMHAKAVATGKKVSGYTAEELDADATRYEKMLA